MPGEQLMDMVPLQERHWTVMEVALCCSHNAVRTAQHVLAKADDMSPLALTCLWLMPWSAKTARHGAAQLSGSSHPAAYVSCDVLSSWGKMMSESPSGMLTLGFDAAVTIPVTITSWLTRSACAPSQAGSELADHTQQYALPNLHVPIRLHAT
jgi:hypothetical protein